MITDKALAILKAFEGCKLTAYNCPAGVPTIGFGATFYENRTRVKIGDKISQAQADALLIYHVKLFEMAMKELVTVKLTDNQWSALVVLVFNIGVGNFSKSTLLKLVNQNPNNPDIKVQWLKWCRANGKVMNGLIRRRICEYELYNTKPV